MYSLIKYRMWVQKQAQAVVSFLLAFLPRLVWIKILAKWHCQTHTVTSFAHAAPKFTRWLCYPGTCQYPPAGRPRTAPPGQFCWTHRSRPRLLPMPVPWRTVTEERFRIHDIFIISSEKLNTYREESQQETSTSTTVSLVITGGARPLENWYRAKRALVSICSHPWWRL